MKTHETDIPTQQIATQENDRLPSPHEDRRRAQSNQSAPQSRPEKTGRLTFPKTIRLRSRREFQRFAKGGGRLVGRFLCIDCRAAPQAKLGISASTRYGSSPERNRFKRLIREAFRQNYAVLPPSELHIVPRQCAKKAVYSDIASELIRLSHEIK